VAKKPTMDDAFPDVVADAPQKPRGGGFFARLAGRFRRKKEADAFGNADEAVEADAFGKKEEPAAAEDPFGVGDAEEDARFRRKRRLMAVAMILLLLGGGGGATAFFWLAPKPAPKPQPEGSGRVMQTMPPETGPENLSGALIRPPAASDNPDVLRRMGTLAPGASGTPAAAPTTATAAALPPAPAAPQAPAAQPPAPLPAADEPAAPSPRADRDKASRAPRYADIAKPAAPPDALPKGPESDLQKRNAAGLTIPAVAADGRRAWKVYARPFTAPPGMPRVALVVRGLGLTADATRAAIDLLPPEVTLAFDANAAQLPDLLSSARRAGHETLLEIGLESGAFPADDPGPDGLISSLPVEENDRRLERALARGNVYVGVLANGGDRYAASAPHLAALAQTMSQTGLAFVAPAPVARFETAGARASRATVDLHIGGGDFRERVEARLRQAETVARKRGGVVIVADANPLTLSMLAVWMGSMRGKALQPAPVSAMVKE